MRRPNYKLARSKRMGADTPFLIRHAATCGGDLPLTAYDPELGLSVTEHGLAVMNGALLATQTITKMRESSDED